MKSKRVPPRWRIPPDAILIAIIVALCGWMAYHQARQGCLRGTRGCDPGDPVPPRHAIDAAP